MTRLFLVALTLFSGALAGCESSERRALKAEAQRLRVQRDRMAEIAEHLDEHKAAAEAVGDDYERVSRMGGFLTASDGVIRGEILTQTRAATHAWGWTLGGNPISWASLCHQDGALPASRLSISSGAWTLDVPAVESLGPIPWPSSPALREPSALSGRREQQLQADIDAYGSEIQELRRLIGGVADYEFVRAEIARREPRLREPSRVRMLSLIAVPLFMERDAPCSRGSLTVDRRSVEVRCSPVAEDPVAIAAVHAVIKSAPPWKQSGTISIDEKHEDRLRVRLLVEEKADPRGASCPPENEAWANNIAMQRYESAALDDDDDGGSGGEHMIHLVRAMRWASAESYGAQKEMFEVVAAGQESTIEPLEAMKLAIEKLQTAGAVDPTTLRSHAAVLERRDLADRALQAATTYRERVEAVIEGQHTLLAPTERERAERMLLPSLEKAKTNQALMLEMTGILTLLERADGHWKFEGAIEFENARYEAEYRDRLTRIASIEAGSTP